MKTKNQVLCCFGMNSRFGLRCPNEATNVSTFNGQACEGNGTALVWCSEHGPSTRKSQLKGHGWRIITDYERERWTNA